MTLKSIIRKGKYTIISKKILESHLKAQLQQQSKTAHYTINTNVRAISGCRKKKTWAAGSNDIVVVFNFSELYTICKMEICVY